MRLNGPEDKQGGLHFTMEWNNDLPFLAEQETGQVEYPSDSPVRKLRGKPGKKFIKNSNKTNLSLLIFSPIRYIKLWNKSPCTKIVRDYFTQKWGVCMKKEIVDSSFVCSACLHSNYVVQHSFPQWLAIDAHNSLEQNYLLPTYYRKETSEAGGPFVWNPLALKHNVEGYSLYYTIVSRIDFLSKLQLLPALPLLIRREIAMIQNCYLLLIIHMEKKHQYSDKELLYVFKHKRINEEFAPAFLFSPTKYMVFSLECLPDFIPEFFTMSFFHEKMVSSQEDPIINMWIKIFEKTFPTPCNNRGEIDVIHRVVTEDHNCRSLIILKNIIFASLLGVYDHCEETLSFLHRKFLYQWFYFHFSFVNAEYFKQWLEDNKFLVLNSLREYIIFLMDQLTPVKSYFTKNYFWFIITAQIILAMEMLRGIVKKRLVSFSTELNVHENSPVDFHFIEQNDYLNIQKNITKEFVINHVLETLHKPSATNVLSNISQQEMESLSTLFQKLIPVDELQSWLHTSTTDVYSSFLPVLKEQFHHLNKMMLIYSQRPVVQTFLEECIDVLHKMNVIIFKKKMNYEYIKERKQRNKHTDSGRSRSTVKENSIFHHADPLLDDFATFSTIKRIHEDFIEENKHFHLLKISDTCYQLPFIVFPENYITKDHSEHISKKQKLVEEIKENPNLKTCQLVYLNIDTLFTENEKVILTEIVEVYSFDEMNIPFDFLYLYFNVSYQTIYLLKQATTSFLYESGRKVVSNCLNEICNNNFRDYLIVDFFLCKIYNKHSFCAYSLPRHITQQQNETLKTLHNIADSKDLPRLATIGYYCNSCHSIKSQIFPSGSFSSAKDKETSLSFSNILYDIHSGKKYCYKKKSNFNKLFNSNDLLDIILESYTSDKILMQENENIMGTKKSKFFSLFSKSNEIKNLGSLWRQHQKIDSYFSCFNTHLLPFVSIGTIIKTRTHGCVIRCPHCLTYTILSIHSYTNSDGMLSCGCKKKSILHQIQRNTKTLFYCLICKEHNTTFSFRKVFHVYFDISSPFFGVYKTILPCFLCTDCHKTYYPYLRNKFSLPVYLTDASSTIHEDCGSMSLIRYSHVLRVMM